MKTMGIMLVILGLALAVFFVSPALPPASSPDTVHRPKLIVTSKEGVIAGVAMVVVGSILVRRHHQK